MTFPARQLRVLLRPRPSLRGPEAEWHAILAESLRLGDDEAVCDLQGAACYLFGIYGLASERRLLARRMAEVRTRTIGQPFVLELRTGGGPLRVQSAGVVLR